MAETINTRVSNPMPLTRKPFTGDKCPWPEPAICFYKVEDYDNSDSVDDAVIHVKNYKASTDTKQNINMLTFPVIKYFDHQGPKIVHVLRDMMVSLFEHLGFTNWKGIDRRWMFVEKFLKGPYLIKFRNIVLS